MGMLDGKPFVPKTGQVVQLRHRRYVLKWWPRVGRALFSFPYGASTHREIPSYLLSPQIDKCARQPCIWHFDVLSLRTGKVYDSMIVYMVQVVEGDPTVKRPWWHDNRHDFRRNEEWHL